MNSEYKEGIFFTVTPTKEIRPYKQRKKNLQVNLESSGIFQFLH